MDRRFTLPLRTIVIAATIGTIGLLIAWNEGELPRARAHHSQQELEDMRGGGIGLASGANNYFRASGDCYGCHGPDDVGPVFASTNAAGEDVNPLDNWRSTMMANSARDPFWRAKVSHEVTVNPAHRSALEDKCTSCHAPMGRFDKFLTGGGHYGIAELMDDPIAQDGVSCLACHMQGADSLGLVFSGNLKFDTSTVYGPYGGPEGPPIFDGPMSSFFIPPLIPTYGEHINDAGLCAGCHSLITETVDLDGNLSGDKFVEQATYHEWLNSTFNTNTNPESGVSCQACHMPRLQEGIVISALYDFLTPRSPYGQHHLVGANVFMLNLLKNNLSALNLTSGSVRFDSTIARTTRLLQQNTLMLETTVMSRTDQTAEIDVQLTNLAGHRFPSGYPSRRAFIELLVVSNENDTIFRSGNWEADYEVAGHDAEYEPHHDVITTEDQAQIYELVMGDVNDNKTTVLERAKSPLKDNRLVPLGFSTMHQSYDTTRIAGVPVGDVDFNRYANGSEGSGTDVTHYQVPMGGYTGLITITTRVWYQSVPPRWNEEMFAYNTPEIDLFRDMYEAEDGSPVLVISNSVIDLSVSIDTFEETGLRIYPNPVLDGLLRLDGITSRITGIEVYDMRGALLATHRPNGEQRWQMRLPDGTGTYLVVVSAGGRRFTKRVISN